MSSEHNVLSEEDVGNVIHVVTAPENHSAPGRHGRSFHVKEDIPVN